MASLRYAAEANPYEDGSAHASHLQHNARSRSKQHVRLGCRGRLGHIFSHEPCSELRQVGYTVYETAGACKATGYAMPLRGEGRSARIRC